MKHIRTEEVPATTKEITYKVTCDLCGKDISLGLGKFGVDEVTITHRTGTCYPENGDGEERTVDMCGSCYATKLTPWLESQGVTQLVEEWEY